VRGLLLLPLVWILPAWGHDPITTKLTWSKEVSRIFERRCMPCHQNGGNAPFPLTSWEESRPWAVAIREEVTRRSMPPWNPVRGFGSFRDDPSLTQEELQLIADWVNGGAPEGDPKYLSGKLPNGWSEPSAKGLSATPTGRLAGLRLPELARGEKLQVLLVRPTGETVPLLWIRSFRPAAGREFQFREPVDFPAGSKLITNPAALASKLQALWAPRVKRAPSRGVSRGPGSTGE
jgi:hypothetical protein